MPSSFGLPTAIPPFIPAPPSTTLPLRAQLVFDVFVGHGLGLADSTVTEANWFPVTCEIQNDGPGFNAIVEISAGQFGGGQSRVVRVELPTNTKKRFTVPVYCNNRYRTSVDARLLNEKRKVVAERLGVEARTVVDWQSPLIASLSRTHGGAAALPEAGRNSQLRPATTHLLPELFPDHPNLLPAFDQPAPLGSSYVRKPRLSREGSNVLWIEHGTVIEATDGDYGAEGHVYQAVASLPEFDGHRPIFGVWVVDHEAAGLGIREDTRRITGNLSRFVPHFFH